jgi:hypothetical protein
MRWNDSHYPMTLAVAKRPPVAMGGALAAMVLSLAVMMGCGGEKQPRLVALEGTVTLDGKPLTEGNIRFLPAPGTSGTVMAGAKIADGRFTIPAEKGATPGKYRVEIGASRPSGRKVPHPVSEQPMDELVQFLPERYNLQSTLTAEVTAESPNRFEFALSLK